MGGQYQHLPADGKELVSVRDTGVVGLRGLAYARLMSTRRDFLKTCALGAAAAALPGCGRSIDAAGPSRRPLVVSTWWSGLAANAAAWPLLVDGADPLDAALAGVRTAEQDAANTSVGLGGLPDRDGHVTLDASVMRGDGRAGSVAALEDIVHAADVARAVMEHTPHVMLVGEGARSFAVERGFPTRELLTPESRREWERWREESGIYAPVPNVENAGRESSGNHDTIAQIALGADGRLAGACTTSGMKYKLSGRVGDSPIIGAALFVDDLAGACCATGQGELVMTTCGSFLVVELMRQGWGPAEACAEAVDRIREKYEDWRGLQVGYLAVDPRGRIGAHALVPGFQYAVHDGVENRILDAAS